MVAALGMSTASVSRHCCARGLKPHLVHGLKVARDPRPIERLEDIVGLSFFPPDYALVLCCDEKRQVQALDRRQAVLTGIEIRLFLFIDVFARSSGTLIACSAGLSLQLAKKILDSTAAVSGCGHLPIGAGVPENP